MIIENQELDLSDDNDMTVEEKNILDSIKPLNKYVTFIPKSSNYESRESLANKEDDLNSEARSRSRQSKIERTGRKLVVIDDTDLLDDLNVILDEEFDERPLVKRQKIDVSKKFHNSKSKKKNVAPNSADLRKRHKEVGNQREMEDDEEEEEGHLLDDWINAFEQEEDSSNDLEELELDFENRNSPNKYATKNDSRRNTIKAMPPRITSVSTSKSSRYYFDDDVEDQESGIDEADDECDDYN